MNTQSIMCRIDSLRQRDKQCTKKRGYTKLVADLALQNLIQENGNKTRDNNLGVYLCKFCGFYHIGHER